MTKRLSINWIGERLLTRRAAAVILAGGVAGAALGVAWKRSHRPAPRLLAPNGRTGDLDEASLAILVAAAGAVTGVVRPGGPYAGYYAYQAKHRPGHFDLYRQFAGAVRREAGGDVTRTFAAQPAGRRRAIVDRALDALAAEARSSPFVERLLGIAPPSRYEVAIVHETIALFMRTDAWRQLGYDGWRGSPRGLEQYRKPFAAPSAS